MYDIQLKHITLHVLYYTLSSLVVQRVYVTLTNQVIKTATVNQGPAYCADV